MTLEEARKLATPGPLTAEYTTVLYKTGWVSGRDKWQLGSSETGHFASTDENHLPHGEQAANAALLAHCWNHFGEVVDALESMLEEWRDRDGRRNSGNWRRCAAILAHAKEVKT